MARPLLRRRGEGADNAATALLRLQHLFENENFLNAVIAHEDAPASAKEVGMERELEKLVGDPCVWRILEMSGVPLNPSQEQSRDVCEMQWPQSSNIALSKMAAALAPRASHRERRGAPGLAAGRGRSWLLPRRQMLAKIFRISPEDLRAKPVKFRAYLQPGDDDADYVYEAEEDSEGEASSGDPDGESSDGGSAVDYEAELRRLDAEIKFTECKINGGDDCGSLDSAGDDDAAAKSDDGAASGDAWVEKHHPYLLGLRYDPESDPVLQRGKMDIVQVSDQPRVYKIANFATDEEMDELMSVARAWRGDGKHDSTGRSFEMPIDRVAVAHRVFHRMQALLGIGNDMGSTLRTRRYGPGESHPPHVDWFQITRSDGAKSNLIATAMLNMVTTESGGATEFLDAVPRPLRVQPERGTLVVWWSCTANGVKDPYSLHQGNVIESGEKFTVTQFFYQPLSMCAADNMYGQVTSRSEL